MKKIKVILASLAVLILMGAFNSVGACGSGGPGASSCHASGTYTILGNSYSYDNSVTCREGYYACCGFGGSFCVYTGQKHKTIEKQEAGGPGSEGQ